MSSGIDGGYSRVNESHYPGRIRETSLGEERTDDQRHLAELEEFVKKHKDKSARQQDTVELHDQKEKEPQENPTSEEHQSPEAPQKESEDGQSHLDITI